MSTQSLTQTQNSHLDELNSQALSQEGISISRQYYILSNAGKLIFTNASEKQEAAVFCGVLQALISIFIDEGDKLQMVKSGGTKTVFFLRNHLYFACVCSINDPDSLIRLHLEYLNLQVLSVVTQTQLDRIFQRSPNYDLSILLDGTEPLFESMIKSFTTSIACLTGSLEVYQTPPKVRSLVSKNIAPATSSSVPQLLYTMVLVGQRIVYLSRPKGHKLHPSDIHVITANVTGSRSLNDVNTESWAPICLPKFAPNGFLYLYTRFISNDMGLILLSGDRDAFPQAQRWALETENNLVQRGLVGKLNSLSNKQQPSIKELGFPGVLHFAYKSNNYVQIVESAYEGLYTYPRHCERLLHHYQKIHSLLHPLHHSITGISMQPNKLVYLVTTHEIILGWSLSYCEVYLSVEKSVHPDALAQIARRVISWAKHETLRLFLIQIPTF